MKTIIATLGLAIATLATPASAQAFQATADIYTSAGMVGSSYTGAPGIGGYFGSIGDGGYDAFDGYGIYQNVSTQLSQRRQTELLAGTNTYRFFDTFTNTGTTTYTGQVTFYGDLGSDGSEMVLRNSDGVAVSCQRDGIGGCFYDPVLAINYGSAASATLSGGEFRAVYTLTLAAGQSASILNFVSLSRGVNGPDAASRSAALAIGQALSTDPILTGLSQQQLSTLTNFQVAAVPEPASWAMMIAGFGVVGATARRRKVRIAAIA